MKKLKIYSVDEVQEPLILKLVHSGHGGVALEAVDLDGDPISEGSLLSITSNGFLQLNGRISEELQLPLDNKGRLKLEDYEEKSDMPLNDIEVRAVRRIREKLRQEVLATSDIDNKQKIRSEADVINKMTKALGHDFG